MYSLDATGLELLEPLTSLRVSHRGYIVPLKTGGVNLLGFGGSTIVHDNLAMFRSLVQDGGA